MGCLVTDRKRDFLRSGGQKDSKAPLAQSLLLCHFNNFPQGSVRRQAAIDMTVTVTTVSYFHRHEAGHKDNWGWGEIGPHEAALADLEFTIVLLLVP